MRFLWAILAFLALVHPSRVRAESDPLVPVWSDAEEAWTIRFQDLPIGIATASGRANGIEAPKSMELRLLVRVGSNPVVFRSWNEWSGSENEWELKSKSEYLARSGSLGGAASVWKLKDGKLSLEGGGASIGQILGTRENFHSQPWEVGTSILFRRPPAEIGGEFQVFSPFSAQIFRSRELKAIWNGDGWAQEFSLPMGDGLSLNFKRVSKDAGASFLGEIRRAPFDPQWFSSEEKFPADLAELRSEIDECLAFANDAEREIKRRSQGVPYLLHRRLVNLRTLCDGLKVSLSRVEEDKSNQEKFIKALREEVRLQEKESRRELPQALASSPEWGVFSRDELRRQTVRVATYFVRRGRTEVSAQLAVEQERKVNLDLRVQASVLAERAVLRGVMKMKESAVSLAVVSVPDSKQKASHLIPAKEIMSAKDPSALVQSVCAKEGGKVGVNLDGDGVELIRSDFFRGLWDISARTQIVPEFLLRAFSQKECDSLVVAAPSRLLPEARSAVERFRNDILQTENRFQISNGRYTKFRVLPGRYDLTLSSYVNGAKIGQQEIRVPDKSDSSVAVPFR